MEHGSRLPPTLRECLFTYESPPIHSLTSMSPTQAELRCQTHNCTVMFNHSTCIIGRMEQLEARITKFENGSA